VVNLPSAAAFADSRGTAILEAEQNGSRRKSKGIEGAGGKILRKIEKNC
jgi:hypothetical protein